MQNNFVSWCSELLSPLGLVRSRRMFGGHGLYVDGIFIALIAGEQLYLKVDEATRAEFVAAGCRAFEYHTAAGHRGVMSYFSAPAEAMDSPALMQPWARLALASALRAQASKAAAASRASSAAPRQSRSRKPPPAG